MVTFMVAFIVTFDGGLRWWPSMVAFDGGFHGGLYRSAPR
jgi:hypothetical protein